MNYQVNFTVPIVTSNPNNGATGNTRVAAIIRAKKRAEQRSSAMLHTRRARTTLSPLEHVCVTVTRVAPSTGLDPHDGLGAALKGAIDGIADGLGLRNDRDPHVTWVLSQRRGRPREYSVDVQIVTVEG